MFFNVLMDKFRVYGNANHVATSMIILNSNNKIVYSNLYIDAGIDTIFINKPLPLNDILTIYIAHHGSNNDISQFGSYDIFVNKNMLKIDINPDLNLTLLNFDEDNKLEITFPIGTTNSIH